MRVMICPSALESRTCRGFWKNCERKVLRAISRSSTSIIGNIQFPKWLNASVLFAAMARRKSGSNSRRSEIAAPNVGFRMDGPEFWHLLAQKSQKSDGESVCQRALAQYFP